MSQNYSVSQSYSGKAAQMALFRQVYLWMTFALAITGLTSMVVASNPTMVHALFSNQMLFWGIIIAEVVVVLVLTARLAKMSFATATLMFILYSLLNGIVMSVIFLAYTTASIASTFFVTAGTFAAMSLYGALTKRDLSSWGNLLFMALIGVIIATVVNMFWTNSTLYWIISCLGVVVFVGLTAYDTQKIKQMLSQPDLEVNDSTKKIALLGALSLYLDFINLFLFILRFMGGRK